MERKIIEARNSIAHAITYYGRYIGNAKYEFNEPNKETLISMKLLALWVEITKIAYIHRKARYFK